MRKNTFRDKLGSSQLEGLKGSNEDQRKVPLRKNLSLLGSSLEKEMSRAVRAGSWPTSERPMCLKVEIMVAGKSATWLGASCLAQKR